MENMYPSNWDELRLAQKEHDGHKCCTCGITAKQLEELGWGPLEVHHINQGPPHYAGPYHKEVVGINLMTLCRLCHEGVTNSVRIQRYRLDPNKQVRALAVEEPEEVIPRTSSSRISPQIQIAVTTEDTPSPTKRESSARRIEINLFSNE